MSIGDFPETWSQRILVGIISVGRLGVINRHKPKTSSTSIVCAALKTYDVCKCNVSLINVYVNNACMRTHHTQPIHMLPHISHG